MPRNVTPRESLPVGKIKTYLADLNSCTSLRLALGLAASLVGFLNDLRKLLSCRQSEVRQKMMAACGCFTDLMIVSVCHYLRLTSRVMSVTQRDTFNVSPPSARPSLFTSSVVYHYFFASVPLGEARPPIRRNQRQILCLILYKAVFSQSWHRNYRPQREKAILCLI